jgi:methionyl-tRNA formyltransferase
MGTPEFAAHALAALIHASTPIVGVVTQPDKPKGRDPLPSPPPVKVLAQAHGLPVVQPAKLRSPDFLEWFRGCQPDIAVVAAYGKLLPREVLELPRLGCVNLHASILPRHRGAAPIQHAILAGDTESGITLMQMDPGLDTGPMLLTRRLPLHPEETAATLHDKLAVLAGEVAVEGLAALARGELAPVPQDDARATWAPMLERAHGRIDWSRGARAVHAHVRAFAPWPGAHSVIRDHQVKVFPFTSPERPAGALGEPGLVLSAGPAGVEVACGEGAVMLQELQLEGRKRLPAAEFLRGFPLQAGDRFLPAPSKTTP